MHNIMHYFQIHLEYFIIGELNFAPCGNYFISKGFQASKNSVQLLNKFCSPSRKKFDVGYVCEELKDFYTSSTHRFTL